MAHGRKCLIPRKKKNPEDKVLADIDALVDWQLRGGEQDHFYRSYNAVKHHLCAHCGEPADGHGHGGGGPPLGAIRVDDAFGGYVTLQLQAGVYHTLYFADIVLPLADPITLDEPGALVITMSPVQATEAGEVFFIRIGRPRRTRLVQA